MIKVFLKVWIAAMKAGDFAGATVETCELELGELSETTTAAESGFSGVSGMTPLQKSFLPKFIFPWIDPIRALQVALSRSLMLTTPFGEIVVSFLQEGHCYTRTLSLLHDLHLWEIV